MAMVSLLSQLPPRRRGIRAAVAYLNQVPAVFRVLSWPRGSLQRSIGGTMMATGHGPWDSRFRHVVLTLVSQRTLNLCWADQERLRLIFPRHPAI